MATINQYTGDGSTTNFNFTFQIAQNAKVNVYKTLSGNIADETLDLLPDTDYVLVYTTPTTTFTVGVITFTIPPAEGDIITITPLPAGSVSIDFTQTTQLNPTNLNNAFAQHTVPIDYSFGLYTDRSLRYDINIDESSIAAYNTLLPALSDGGFWRRLGSNMITQGYDQFVDEVGASIDVDTVLATTDAFSWANLDQGVLYTDNEGREGFSAFSGSYWANQWSNALVAITDPQGNSGNSARYWANIAQEAISQAGGLIEEILVENSTVTTINLVNGAPLVAWQNVTTGSLSVYKNGLRFPQTGEYTLNIVPTPTVANPSQLILNTPLVLTDVLTINRSEPQGQGGTMNAVGDNALFDPSTLLAARDLSNSTLSAAFILLITDTLFDVGDIVSKIANPSSFGWAGTWEAIPDDLAHMSGSSYAELTNGKSLRTGPTEYHTLSVNELPSGIPLTLNSEATLPLGTQTPLAGSDASYITTFTNNNNYTTLQYRVVNNIEPATIEAPVNVAVSGTANGTDDEHRHDLNIKVVQAQWWRRTE